jgi:hypothetical protein
VGLSSLTWTRGRHIARAAAADREIVAVGALVAFILAITATPYLYAYSISGADRQFMGIVLNVPDTAQYFSWAHESQSGLFIANKLTSEQGPAVYFNLFWWGVGQLAGLLHVGLAEATQLVRPFAGAVFIGALYWFTGLVTTNRVERWTAFLVATLGGGLGWILIGAKQLTGALDYPLDVYVTEANAFLTVMAFPMQAMAGALLVVTLGLGALALERHSSQLALLAGVVGLALGVQHGYDLVIVYAVLGTLGAILALRDGDWLRTIWLGALMCAPSLPAVGYLALLTRASAIWRGVLSQYGNAGVYTPNPMHLLVLIGIPLLVVLVGLPLLVVRRRLAWDWFQHAPARKLLIYVWLSVGFLLLYIPTDFQIKMLACWQVPVAIVATRLLFGWLRPAQASRSLAMLFVLAVIPVNLYLLTWRFVDLDRRDYPYYLSGDEVAALQWLEQNSAPSDVVLSSLTIGQYVPSASGNTVYLAHWAQTLDFFAKRDAVAHFFDAAASDDEREAILTNSEVSYVIQGPAERSLGGFDPSRSAMLERAFETPSVSVYRVHEKSRQ